MEFNGLIENLIFLYKEKFNLHNANFIRIKHEDAMVAIVFKVVLPNHTTFILKVHPREEDYFREIYFLKFLSNLLPIPQIIQAEPSSLIVPSAILMEYLPGEVLKRNDITNKLAYKIGELLACIHLNKVEKYGDIANDNLSNDPRIPFTIKFEEGFSECCNHLPEIILKKTRYYFNSHIDLLTQVDGPCIMHRDFRPGNVMAVNNEVTGIIDWGSARGGFAEEDFCSFELNEWSTSPDIKKCFIDGYSNIRPIPNYKLIMPLLLINRALAIIGFTIKTKTWNGVNSSLYQVNRQYLESFFIL
ncbi:MAG: aminoglycoside phosphotransferase family protein [Sphingobacteriia bacterium]|nr:aminoglycoside phosphotransferase family protein [Sphingobacteriia bacterium]